MEQVEVSDEEAVGCRLQHWAEVQPDKPFFKCSDRWVSYGDALRLTDQLSAGLQALGVGKGHHVVSLMPNCEEYVLLSLACARVGAIHFLINPFLRGEFLRYQLVDSDVETLVTDRAGLEMAKPVLSELPNLGQVVVTDDCSEASAGGAVPIHRFWQVASSDAAPRLPRLCASDLCSVIYTSGTTGMPKGIMMTHGYYLVMCREIAASDLILHGDTLLTPFQLFHTSGQVYCLMNALDAGASVAFQHWFSASALMGDARDAGATILYGPGSMASALVKTAPSIDDRNHPVRLLFAVPVHGPTQAALEARFGFRVIAEHYGQGEANIVSGSRPSDEKRPGTAGRVTPYFDLRIIDEHDSEVATGDVGEITVRPRLANGMFSGYWKKPAETLDAWRNLWHHTGDNGRLDADGYLTFVDRKKDTLRRRGENVSSIELEQAIMLHPGIVGVACHPIPSELGEDDIKACIIPAEGFEHTPAQLFEFFKQNLPYFAIPRYVEFVKELPLSTMLRVQKFKLVERGITPETWDFDHLGLVVERVERRAN